MAVVIARHACVAQDRAARQVPGGLSHAASREDCTGCRICLEDFECPALSLDEADGRVVIDGGGCVGCGVCVHVCPEGAISAKKKLRCGIDYGKEGCTGKSKWYIVMNITNIF